MGRISRSRTGRRKERNRKGSDDHCSIYTCRCGNLADGSLDAILTKARVLQYHELLDELELRSLNLPALLDLNVRGNFHDAKPKGHCIPASVPGNDHQHTSKLSPDPGFKSDATQLVCNEERHLQQVCHYEKDLAKLHEISYQMSRVWNMERNRLGIPPIEQSTVFEKMVELVRPSRSLVTSPCPPNDSGITSSVTNRYADGKPTPLPDSARSDLRSSFLDKYRNDDKFYNVDNLCRPRDDRHRHSVRERRGRRNVEKRNNHSYDDRRHSNASKPYVKVRDNEGRPHPSGSRAKIQNGSGPARFRREDRTFKKESSTSPRHEFQGDSSSRESSISPCDVRSRKLSHSSSHSDLSLGRSRVVNGSAGQLQRSRSSLELFSSLEQNERGINLVNTTLLTSTRGRSLEKGAKEGQQKQAKDEDTPKISKPNPTVEKLKNDTKLPRESDDKSPCDKVCRPSKSSCEARMSSDGHSNGTLQKTVEDLVRQEGESVKWSPSSGRSVSPKNACKFEGTASCRMNQLKPRRSEQVNSETNESLGDTSREKRAQLSRSPITSEASQDFARQTNHVEDKVEVTVDEALEEDGSTKLGPERVASCDKKDSRMSSKQDTSDAVEMSKLSDRPKSSEEEYQSIDEAKASTSAGSLHTVALNDLPTASCLSLVASGMDSAVSEVAKMSAPVIGADCVFFNPQKELHKDEEEAVNIALCSNSPTDDAVQLASSAVVSSTEHSLVVVDKGQSSKTVLASVCSTMGPVPVPPHTTLSPNCQSYQPLSQTWACSTPLSSQSSTSLCNLKSCQRDDFHKKVADDSLRKTLGNTNPALPQFPNQVIDADKNVAGQTCVKPLCQTREGNGSDILGLSSVPSVTKARRETEALQPLKENQTRRLKKHCSSSVDKPQQSRKSDDTNAGGDLSVSYEIGKGVIPRSADSSMGASSASVPLLIDSSSSTLGVVNSPALETTVAEPPKISVDHVAGVLLCNSPQEPLSYLDTESNVEVLVMSDYGPSEWICEPLTPVGSDEETFPTTLLLPAPALPEPCTEIPSSIDSSSVELPLSLTSSLCSSLSVNSVVTTLSTTDNPLISSTGNIPDSIVPEIEARKKRVFKRRSSLGSPDPVEKKMQPHRQSSCPIQFSFSCSSVDRLLDREDSGGERTSNDKLFEIEGPLSPVSRSNTVVDLRPKPQSCIISSNSSGKAIVAERSTPFSKADEPHEACSQQQHLCKTPPPSTILLPATMCTRTVGLQERCGKFVPSPSPSSTIALNTLVTTSLPDHRSLILDEESVPCSILPNAVTSANLLLADSLIGGGCTVKKRTLQDGKGIFTAAAGSTSTKPSFSEQSVARPATLSIKCHRSKPREVMSGPTVPRTKDQIYQEIFGGSGALAIRSPPGLAKLTGSKLKKGRKRKERSSVLQTEETGPRNSLSEGQAIKRAHVDVPSQDTSLTEQPKKPLLELTGSNFKYALKDAMGRRKRRRKENLDSPVVKKDAVSSVPGQINCDRTHDDPSGQNSSCNRIVMPSAEDTGLSSNPYRGEKEHRKSKSDNPDAGHSNLPRRRKKTVNVVSKKRHRMSKDANDSPCNAPSESVPLGANDESSYEPHVESLLLSPLADDKAVTSNIFDLMTTTGGKEGKTSNECLEILGCSMEKEEYASIRALCKRYNRELEKKQEEVKLLRDELGRTESQLLRMTELTNNQDKKIVELAKERAEISKRLRAKENATTKLRDSIGKREQKLEETISQTTDKMNREIQKLKVVIEKHAEENQLQKREIEGLVDQQKVLEEKNRNQSVLIAELRREVEQKAGQINKLSKKGERQRAQCRADLDKTSNLPFALHMFLSRYLGTRLCPAPPMIVKEEKTQSEKELGSSEITGQD